MKEYIVQANAPETIRTFDEHNAPELVRCKECKNGKPYANGKLIGCEKLPGLFRPDWFCADGERRDPDA